MIQIGESPRHFTEENLDELLPVVRRITARAKDRTDATMARFGDLSDQDPERKIMERLVLGYLRQWMDKIRMLGGEPDTDWRVHFPGVDGVFCWQLGKDQVHQSREG